MCPIINRLAFDHNALSQNVGRNYTIALLFCYEYFKHGPGFDLTEVLKEESEDMKHWISIFRSWIAHSQDSAFKEKHPNFRAENLIPSTGAVLSLNGYPDNDIQTLARHLQDRVVGDDIKWEITEDIRQYQMLGQIIWASWDSATSNFESAVQAAVHDSKVTYFPGHSRVNMPDPGHAQKSFGETVDQYMQAFWSTGLFRTRASNRTRSVGGLSGGACFKPGTKVLTFKGPKAIEDLVEGDDVLTRGGEHKQWGRCSDEQVVHSTMSQKGPIQLFGFNEENPFFSAGHVFHTTMGLRALDPVLAKSENPWLNVGRLQVGHSVIRTDDGTHYHPVQINKLSVESASCPTIYGVHLHEGLRSYHADGYLVHLNYPEITTKSISRLLSSIEPTVRHSMLQHLSELQPLFERFGAQTLMTALDRQLRDDYTDLNPLQLWPTQHDQSPLKNAVEHLRRGWFLQYENKDAPDRGIPLPSVEVFEGVVMIDGAYCKSATAKGDLIMWSRRLPELGWEHCCIQLDAAFMMGNGYVYYSPDFEAFDPSDHRRVIAMPTKRNIPAALVVENSVTNPSVQTVLGGSGTKPMPLMKSRTFLPRHLEAVLNQTEGDFAPISTRESVIPKANFQELQSVALPSLSIKNAMVRATEVPLPSTSNITLPAQASAWPELDNYAVNYDLNEWSDVSSTVGSPRPYCQLFTTIDDESKVGPTHLWSSIADSYVYQTYLARIPELDAIRDATFADAQKHEVFGDVAEFYVCHRSKASVSGNTMYEFQCINPQLIAQLADNFDYREPQFNNLTFKNLGLDIQLPFVFSVMQVTFSFDAQELTGVIRAFDPNVSSSIYGQQQVSLHTID